MSDELKTSQAWTEVVAYVECPHCDHTIELGTGLIWSAEKDRETCPNCGKEFDSIEPEGDD